MSDRDRRHRAAMQKQKVQVDRRIAAASEERGLVILLTGDGKGKSSSAFGMVMRCLGHGRRVAVVQFIKGAQLSGEELYLRKLESVPLVQMGTGFTWDTQDRRADMAAAARTWEAARRFLKDPAWHLVVLDELTYMLAYDYLPREDIVAAIRGRPPEQSVVITGRGGGAQLREIADTVAEVKNIKHAYDQGIKARPGIDF